MSKKEIFDYLDNQDNTPQDPEAVEMANLLREIETMEIPDPGQDYWNNFNARLNQKLEQPPKASFAWLKWPAWGAAFAAFALILFFNISPKPADPQLQEPPSFDNLSSESFALLSDIYLSDDEDDTYELAESELDTFINELNPYDQSPLIEMDLNNFDANEFKTLWQTEG